MGAQRCVDLRHWCLCCLLLKGTWRAMLTRRLLVRQHLHGERSRLHEPDTRRKWLHNKPILIQKSRRNSSCQDRTRLNYLSEHVGKSAQFWNEQHKMISHITTLLRLMWQLYNRERRSSTAAAFA